METFSTSTEGFRNNGSRRYRKMPQVTLLEMTYLFFFLFNNISIMQKQLFVCKTRWNFQNLRWWRWLGKSATKIGCTWIIAIQFIRWKRKVTPVHGFEIPIWVVSTKWLCKCNPCLESTPLEEPCLNMCTPWTENTSRGDHILTID